MKILTRLFETKKEEGFINDRRQAKRYDILLKLSYYDPLTKHHGESLTKDVSKTGLRFPVDTKFTKGTMLDMKIEDPNNNESLSSKAKVIWVEEFVYGDDAEGTRYEVGVRLLKRRLF